MYEWGSGKERSGGGMKKIKCHVLDGPNASGFDGIKFEIRIPAWQPTPISSKRCEEIASDADTEARTNGCPRLVDNQC